MKSPPMLRIRPLTPADAPALRAFLETQWGAAEIVVHDTVYTPADLAGFVAEEDGVWLGLATYHMDAGGCELVTLDSLRENQGIGGALLQAVTEAARASCCARLWLITTNDNLHALAFYQRRSFVLVQVHRDAVTRARLRKPSIPLLADNGIPIRDELELEFLL